MGRDSGMAAQRARVTRQEPSTLRDPQGRSGPSTSSGSSRAQSRDEHGRGATGSGSLRAKARRERAALVGLIAGRARRLEAERSLDELAGLAEAAGAEVVLRVLQERPKPDPSTFLGAGKIQTLALSAAETDVDVVIFDNELTPAQLREIEKAIGRKIVDRTQLILDIFARRARTREGKLQVCLLYTSPSPRDRQKSRMPSSA